MSDVTHEMKIAFLKKYLGKLSGGQLNRLYKSKLLTLVLQ